MNATQEMLEVRLYPTKDAPVGASLRGDTWWGRFEDPAGPRLLAEPIASARLAPQWVEDSPGLIVSDVDSTLIDEEVIDQLAELAGVGAEVAAVTEQAMQGQIDFETSLRRRVSRLRGLSASALAEVYQGLHVRAGAAELVTWIHSLGGRIGVVSGGFSQIVGLLAADLGLDYFLANELEIADGALTGRVIGPIVTAATKQDCLQQWSIESPGWTISLGDGANDIPLLQTADLGVAVCAKPSAKQAVPNYLEVPQLDAVIGLAGRSARP